MTDTGCRDDVASGLTKVLWTASQLDNESDFEDLLDAIRVLRPKWSGVGTVAAWRYVRRQKWMDARRVLEDEDEQIKRSGLHAALMALCLFGLEDPLWHSYARMAAEQRESPDAARIGFRLLERAAKSDLRAAPEPTPEPAVSQTASAGQDTAGFSAGMSWVRA
ncbi:hypothetical protein GXB81_28610 [Paraburkholderia sp. Ac-20336]|uniref:HrpB1 family type III secretion system apparatus protein n=1 Tax=Burkholderiaceae TaxID=119060 RepID=UPI001422D859|nr:hypothetical protein [Paraburkholderia sp. Ac-20336]MBN3845954.1 hypothetical protein [Paraburkholderia sp. Ac-20342]NIF54095.1 hypothetical protein [Burkholderia sp. Ax-1724]NIF77793.1 hypothetical protein [Paraburkholderia sp. Cy-641]